MDLLSFDFDNLGVDHESDQDSREEQEEADRDREVCKYVHFCVTLGLFWLLF